MGPMGCDGQLAAQWLLISQSFTSHFIFFLSSVFLRGLRAGRRRCVERAAEGGGRRGAERQQEEVEMSGHDSKYFSTTKKGEIPELKEELNSQYKVSLRPC